MGRLLIFLTALFSCTAFANVGELSNLADKANVSRDSVVSYVQSGLSDYNDSVIKNCLKKLDTDKKTTIYALFNYIMYLDLQDDSDKQMSLKETRKLITVSKYAKISVKYCNS